MHEKIILTKGAALKDARKALIMIHGRGAGAEDIVSLASFLNVDGYAILAPRATGNSWYPYSFLAPEKANEPWLSSAIQMIHEVVDDIVAAGIAARDIYFLGFSQGACLTLEYTARNAKKYGGVVAFTGGLIGETIRREKYAGDFGGTPVFIGTSDPDPHVPAHRVRESVNILREMNASVTEKIYLNMGHTINEEEIELANEIVFAL
jgi:phospholipase/carboxylesterase